MQVLGAEVAVEFLREGLDQGEGWGQAKGA